MEIDLRSTKKKWPMNMSLTDMAVERPQKSFEKHMGDTKRNFII
jgi:hypothetical protein